MWGIVGDTVADTSLDPELLRKATEGVLGVSEWGVVANLELPLCDEGVGQRARKVVAWHAPEATAELLAQSGISAVSVANNHATDWGMAGLLATVDALDRAGVASVGAGRDLDLASRAWLSPDQSLAVVGMSCTVPPGSAADVDQPGMASLRVTTRMDVDTNRLEELPLTPPAMSGRFDPTQIEPAVAQVRAHAQSGRAVAVMIHWGVAFTTRVDDYMFDLAELLVDAGATLIMGHHSHTLGAVARYGDALVCFGLGDYVRLPTLAEGADLQRPGLGRDWENWSRVGLCARVDGADSGGDVTLIPFSIDLGTGLPDGALTGSELTQFNGWLNWVSALEVEGRPGWQPVALDPADSFPLRYSR